MDGNEGWRSLPANPGMSLRDWFAGQAMAGMLGGGPEYHLAIKEMAKELGVNEGQVAASAAYEYADAMLRAREARHV